MTNQFGPGYDSFGDISSKQTGIFSDEQAALDPGLSSFNRAHVTPMPGGVACRAQCRKCGGPLELLFEYQEMVAIDCNVNPGPNGVRVSETDWVFNQNVPGWQPVLACRVCQDRQMPVVEPGEAGRLLASARSKGWVDPRGEAPLRQRCQQYAAQILRQGGR